MVYKWKFELWLWQERRYGRFEADQIPKITHGRFRWLLGWVFVRRSVECRPETYNYEQVSSPNFIVKGSDCSFDGL